MSERPTDQQQIDFLFRNNPDYSTRALLKEACSHYDEVEYVLNYIATMVPSMATRLNAQLCRENLQEILNHD
jgi:hypothetical protein